MFSYPVTPEAKPRYLFHNRFGWARANSSYYTKYSWDESAALISKDQTVHCFQFWVDDLSKRINTLFKTITPDLWSALRRQINFIFVKFFHNYNLIGVLAYRKTSLKASWKLKAFWRYLLKKTMNPSFLFGINPEQGSRSSKRGVAKVYMDCMRI